MIAALLPWWPAIRMGLIAAALAATHIYAYNAGVDSERAKVAAEKLIEANKTIGIIHHQDMVTHDVEDKSLKAATKIRTITKTITKEVPVYVSPLSDSQCVVPVGFVRVHNAASSGTLPDTSGGADANPSGVALSAVAETVADNYGTCLETRQYLIDLQDWVKRQEQVANIQP